MAQFTRLEKDIRQFILGRVFAGEKCPETEEIAGHFSIGPEKLRKALTNLEAGMVLAVQNPAHENLSLFQGEPVMESLPRLGEVFYARPFSTFPNQHPVTVNGKQKWWAECAVEACGLSAIFPGREVVVNSLCRLTKTPVEIVGKDGRIVHFAPRNLTVHLGFPIARFPEDAVGWCDFNSFFESPEAAMEWRKKHPAVKDGILRDPVTMSRFIAEIVGKGRLDYGYRFTLPIGRVLFHGLRYGFYKKATPLGIPVPDPFWMPNISMLKAMKEKGYGNYADFSLV